jgi:hypothetical protein
VRVSARSAGGVTGRPVAVGDVVDRTVADTLPAGAKTRRVDPSPDAHDRAYPAIVRARDGRWHAVDDRDVLLGHGRQGFGIGTAAWRVERIGPKPRK